jgi:hypothetical protein
MTQSKLKYARELAKEKNRLEVCSQKEHEKKIRNYRKLELIKKTTAEVTEEQKKVSAEIKTWLETADLPVDIKNEVEKYYINGCDRNILNENFSRYIKRVFGTHSEPIKK